MSCCLALAIVGVIFIAWLYFGHGGDKLYNAIKNFFTGG